MLKGFDMLSMLQASDAPLSANASRRSGLLASSALVAFGLCFCLIALIISSKQIDSVYAVPLKPYVSVKQYASQKIQSKDQWVCLSRLYGKESAWNAYAVNGTHYGIPQLKNDLMIGLDAYSQIDYGLKYIAHRYGTDKHGYTNACKALLHFEIKGWH